MGAGGGGPVSQEALDELGAPPRQTVSNVDVKVVGGWMGSTV